jgi:hypothetical protein
MTASEEYARPSLPYRTAFETSLDYRGARDVIVAELRHWLREKAYNVDAFDAGLLSIGKGAILRTATTNNSAGC